MFRFKMFASCKFVQREFRRVAKVYFLFLFISSFQLNSVNSTERNSRAQKTHKNCRIAFTSYFHYLRCGHGNKKKKKFKSIERQNAKIEHARSSQPSDCETAKPWSGYFATFITHSHKWNDKKNDNVIVRNSCRSAVNCQAWQLSRDNL